MPSIVQLERTKAELALALRELDNLGTGRRLATDRVGKNPGFFKKAQPSGFFWVFLGFFGFFWVFLGFFFFLCLEPCNSDINALFF